MEPIDRYLERLAEPGMRDYLREMYGIDRASASYPRASLRKVKAIEKSLGVPLPPSYKTLVTMVGPYDGGYEVLGVNDPFGLGVDIAAANKNRVMPGLIEVVPTDSGDAFCFDTRRRDDRGEYPIVRFDHEVAELDGAEFETVAPDLGQFLLDSLPDEVPAYAMELARDAPRPDSAVVQWIKGFWSRQWGRIEYLVTTISGLPAALRAGPGGSGTSWPTRSSIETAIDENDLEKVTELLDSGADPNAVLVFRTPLENAISKANLEMITLLIKYGADVRAPNRYDQNALQEATSQDRELGGWLFRQLSDATLVDAAQAGTLDDLRRLVEAGGDVNMLSQDVRKLSPLQAAAIRGDAEIAAFLLDRGAQLHDTNGKTNRLMSLAANRARSVETTALFLKQGGDPNITDDRGHSKLASIALVPPGLEVLEVLIAAGADVNFRAPDGATPLHEAVECNIDRENQTIRVLVKHGANLNAQDDCGFTPLHTAIEKRDAHSAEVLLDLGADPTIRDRKGRTPIDLAGSDSTEHRGLPEVIHRLRTMARSSS